MFKTYRYSILVLFCMLFLNSNEAQVTNLYPVLQTLSQQLNTKIPILDSLFSMPNNFKAKEWNSVSRAEKREVKKAIIRQAGYKINPSSWTGVTFIPAQPIFKALIALDDESLKTIEKSQPFYMISNPIFFRKTTKAIVTVTLIRGYSYTYILERTSNEWKVIKSIYNWMN